MKVQNKNISLKRHFFVDLGLLSVTSSEIINVMFVIQYLPNLTVSIHSTPDLN